MHRQMVEGETVDRYGRKVALVKVKGAGVATTLVRAGYAWDLRQVLLAGECDNWKRLESKARQDKIGLWAETKLMPP